MKHWVVLCEYMLRIGSLMMGVLGISNSYWIWFNFVESLMLDGDHWNTSKSLKLWLGGFVDVKSLKSLGLWG